MYPANKTNMGCSWSEKAKALVLVGFHALSGADVTGRLARISKHTWFKHYVEAGVEVHEAFSTTCTDDHLSENCEKTLETFVCQVYSPK